MAPKNEDNANALVPLLPNRELMALVGIKALITEDSIKPKARPQ
jgi:hypothetical protein